MAAIAKNVQRNKRIIPATSFERRELFVQVLQRGFEHGAIARVPRGLNVVEHALARQFQAIPLAMPTSRSVRCMALTSLPATVT